MTRGDASAEAPAVEVEMVSPLGAGDAFTGALVAAMDAGEWNSRAAPHALGRALEAGARACAHWGRSHWVSAQPGPCSSAHHQSVEHFPEGKELTVKVDPDDPQSAVLWG